MTLSPRTRRWLSSTLRIIVTLVLLWWLARSLDFAALRQLFVEMAPGWIVASCFTILVARFLIALRWKLLLDVHGLALSLWTLNKVIFISMFAGQFLPGVIGTDVVRGYRVAKEHGRAGTVAMTLLLDRVIGIYAMSVVAVVGAVISEAAGRPTRLLPAIASFLAALLIGAWVGLAALDRLRSRPWFQGTRFDKPWNKLLGVASSATGLLHHPRALAAVFGVSIGIVTVRCFVFYSLYRAFGSPVPFDALMVFVPVMFVAVLIPLSVGGLGVREAALVYLLRIIGVPAEVSVSVGLMFQFLQIVTSSPGIVFWLSERKAADA